MKISIKIEGERGSGKTRVLKDLKEFLEVNHEFKCSIDYGEGYETLEGKTKDHKESPDDKKNQENKKDEKNSKNKKNNKSYGDHLKSFVGESIFVKDVYDQTYKGKCLGINEAHLNLIMETDDNAIVVIKNPQIIRKEK